MCYEEQQLVRTETLQTVLLDTIRRADRAYIRERAILDALGIGRGNVMAADLWATMLEQLLPDHPTWTPLLRRMLKAGTLAGRISNCVDPSPTRAQLCRLYAELAECLQNGELFRAP
jgi:hypothetical protein